MHAARCLQRRRWLALWAGTACGLARAQSVDEFGAATLKGAGSTFAHPLMALWAREYRAWRNGGPARAAAGGGLDDEANGAALDYEAVGSQAGIQRVRARAVDFGVSEMPLTAADLRRAGLLQVPLATGAVAIAVNLEGNAAPLRITPAVLGDIFLGRIQRWSDPAIAQLNPRAGLPAAPIAVVHRADGSGTTFTFTQYLSQTHAAWRSQVGSDLLVNWPVGEGYKGNAAVARALQRLPNTIGYVNLAQAIGDKLPLASVENAAGRFVLPDAASVRAALAGAHWEPAAQFEVSLVNMPGDASWPIVAAIYGLAPATTGNQRQRSTRAFLEWTVTHGRAGAERLGYVGLPAATVRQVLAALR
jgi:phosphate transport system substrate-binding protein